MTPRDLPGPPSRDSSPSLPARDYYTTPNRPGDGPPLPRYPGPFRHPWQGVIGMRAVVQRVRSASVSVGGETVGAVGRGLLILLAVAREDTTAEADWLADKLVNLRLFADGAGKMNLSLLDVSGAALVVSQFTLYGDCSKGRRPSFVRSASPELAVPLYEHFVGALRAFGVRAETGRFGADMQVELVNDGPVTVIVDREANTAGGGCQPPEVSS